MKLRTVVGFVVLGMVVATVSTVKADSVSAKAARTKATVMKKDYNDTGEIVSGVGASFADIAFLVDNRFREVAPMMNADDAADYAVAANNFLWAMEAGNEQIELALISYSAGNRNYHLGENAISVDDFDTAEAKYNLAYDDYYEAKHTYLWRASICLFAAGMELETMNTILSNY